MIERMIFVKNKDAAFRIIESQAVILTPADSYLHTLNETGTFIWELLNGKNTIEDIIDKVCEEFDADKRIVAKDISHFTEDLIRRKLIITKKNKGR